MNNLRKSLYAQLNWFQKQGFKVTFSKSSGWVEFAKGVFQAFPYHWVINPSEDEIMEVLKKNRLIALRYSTSLTSPSGQISYHVIYDKNSYELSSLPKKARHDVTHGLRHASYEPIPMSKLAYEGWELRRETLLRQGRQHAETRESWETMCLCAEGLPGFEPWGAFHDGELIAALLSFTLEDTVCILYQQSKTNHLEYGVNNTLTYVFTHEVLKRPDIHCVFYGLHSLDAPSSVDQYKIRMGFTAKPVRQRVVFNPIIEPLLNQFSYKILKEFYFITHSNTLAKAIGLVRFYLQGKHSLYKQEWPDVLLGNKETILANLESFG